MNSKQKALLAKIASATEMFYVDPDHKDVKALLAENAIQVNHDYKNEAGMIAARVTPTDETPVEPATQNQAAHNAIAAQPVKANTSMFKIAAVALPAAALAGRGSNTYPFAALEIGQAFFVPATAERPNPSKSLASTVTSANERYSEEIAGQTRTNRKGVEVSATKPLRKFVIRKIEDGAKAGFGDEFAGAEGAAIYRIPLESDAE